MPDVPTVANVFEAILGTIQIDAVQTMGVDREDSYAAATPETHQFGSSIEVSSRLLGHLYFGTNCEMGFLHSR